MIQSPEHHCHGQQGTCPVWQSHAPRLQAAESRVLGGKAMIVPRAPRILPVGPWPSQGGPGRKAQALPSTSLPSPLSLRHGVGLQSIVERLDSTGLRKDRACRHAQWLRHFREAGEVLNRPGLDSGGTTAGLRGRASPAFTAAHLSRYSRESQVELCPDSGCLCWCPHRPVHMSPCSSHRKCHVTSYS